MSRILARPPAPAAGEAGAAIRTPGLAPPIVHDVLAAAGRPLSEPLRQRFEPLFGHDFSTVRVHDDARAARSADALDALAYTVGQHIVLGGRTPCPERTMAHELAHVVQQQGGSRPSGSLPIESPHSAAESAAVGAAQAALSGRVSSLAGGSRPAVGTAAVVRREPKPDAAAKQPDQAGGAEKAPDKAAGDDEPTPWLTLQAQGLAQYQRVYSIPRPPPWMLGAQLAANLQLHSGKTGFELALLGQYGHIFKQSVDATGVPLGDPRRGTGTGPGNQWQFGLQPSYLLVNTDSGTQISLFGQGGYGYTFSRDPAVAGRQFSLLGGAQATQDLTKIGPFKLQGVAGLAGGGAWSKGPQDDSYSAAPVWQVTIGIQLAWDAVKRPAPPARVEVPLPDSDRKPVPDDAKKDPTDEARRADEARKEDDARKKVVNDPDKPADHGPPAPPPPPSDGRVFFVKDKPLSGLPTDEAVVATDGGGESLSTLRTRVQAALAADPTLKIAILGSASIEAPSAQYNCALGSRRAEWLRRQLGVPGTAIADPTDASVTAGSCEDAGGLVSFGSSRAVDTKVEAERRTDRNAVVHFHHR